jgi:hypothetical protein
MKLMVLPAILMTLAFLLYVRSLSTEARQPVVVQSHAGCTLTVTDPPVYTCPTRVYTVEHGKWRYIGPVTPMPGVPAR